MAATVLVSLKVTEVSLYEAFRVSITLNHLDERLLPHSDGKVTVHFLS